MKAIIIYKSSTGFTRTYAEIIAKALSCETVQLQNAAQANLSAFDTLIYGGGIYAGGIAGVKKIKPILAAFKGRKYVFAVGSSPYEMITPEKLCEIHKLNFPQNEACLENFYYLRGGMDYKSMKPIHLIMMKMMCAVIKKQKGADSEQYKEMSSSFNAVNPDSVKELVRAVGC